MKELLKKIIFTSLGAAVITKEKAEELVSKLVDEGDLSQEEGRTLVKEFQDRAQKEREKIALRIKEELEKKYETAGLVTQKELEHLRLEVRDLCVRVKDLEARVSGETQED